MNKLKLNNNEEDKKIITFTSALHQLRPQRHGRRYPQAPLRNRRHGSVAAAAPPGVNLHQLGHSQNGREKLESPAQAGLFCRHCRRHSLLVAGKIRRPHAHGRNPDPGRAAARSPNSVMAPAPQGKRPGPKSLSIVVSVPKVRAINELSS